MDRTIARVLLVAAGPEDAGFSRDQLEEAVHGPVELVRAERLGGALDRMAREAFDAVLLAADLGDPAAIEGVSAVVAAAPEVPVIVLGEANGEEARRAIRAGAQDVVACGHGRERLGQALSFAIERQRRARDLARRAQRDPLTGLANRDLFRDRLTHATARAERENGSLALLYLDLDAFKRINDAFGHDVGDRLLTAVARRLVRAVRRSDTVARLGGDEFGVILEGMAHAEDAAVGARKLLDRLFRPFTVRGHRIRITASIGITLYPADTRRAGDLPAFADTAMYRAKEHGRARYVFYTADMNQRERERLERERDLRRALRREEFRLLFQPQVEPASGRLRGAEVLLRWEHPERGGLEPRDFIALAEDTGVIVPLGEWVLRRACAQAAAWRAAGLPPVALAVNVTESQLRQRRFAATVASILREHGIEPRQLELELVERSPMEEIPTTASQLDDLRRLEVRIAMDDVGIGSFSLGHLRGLPLDALKLDRSLVRAIDEPGTGPALTGGLIDLARGLGLQVVAEGVETAAQLAFLRERGCDAVQGHLISPPLEPDAFVAWLREPAAAGAGLARPRRRGARARGTDQPPSTR